MMRPVGILLFACAVLPAADDPFADLNLEAHGFASFGYLRSWGNDWLDTTTDGSTDFWEAAINAVARPMDRLRIGAQIFARDLGRYDNGQPTLDWAYADWRAADAFGVQVGRYKVPLGLYNEVLDVDAARTPVFLPPAIYALRARDLYISNDGVKVYGFADLGRGGSLDYQAYVGAKSYDTEMGFASYFKELGVGEEITEISVDLCMGGMLHWNTPWEGLGLRLSFADAHGFSVEGATPSLGITTDYEVDDFFTGIASAIWERGDWTVAVEYALTTARGGFRIEPLGISQPFRTDNDSGYLAATWHARQWLELYTAGEVSWADIDDRGGKHLYTGVFAVNLMPKPNWSLKAELRLNHGTVNTSSADLAGGGEDAWETLALKTTVDF